MPWPLQEIAGNKYQLEWSEHYSPIAMAGQVETVGKLELILKDYAPTFPKTKTPFSFTKNDPSNLYKIWSFIIAIIIPFLWMIIIIRIIQQVLSSSTNITGLELTLFFIIIVGVNHICLGLFATYRKYRDRLDVIDQLDLLFFYIKNENTNTTLSDLFYSKNNKLHWKRYAINWDLDDLFPTITLIDLIAIFTSIFSITYIFVWLLRILSLTISNWSLYSQNIYLVFANFVIIATFICFILTGGFFGLRSSRYTKWNGKEGARLIKSHIIVMLIPLVTLIIIDFLSPSFNGSFLIILLFGQTPILTAFTIRQFRNLMSYTRVRYALFRQLDYLRLRMYTQELSQPILINDALVRLRSQSILPTRFLRLYFIAVTAVLSLSIPIFTAFLSSINRLSDILDLISPWN